MELVVRTLPLHSNGLLFVLEVLRGTIFNRTKIWLVKTVEYIGFLCIP